MGAGGGGVNNAIQYSTALEQYTHKRILPVHIIINGKGFFKFSDHIMQTHFAFTHYHK